MQEYSKTTFYSCRFVHVATGLYFIYYMIYRNKFCNSIYCVTENLVVFIEFSVIDKMLGISIDRAATTFKHYTDIERKRMYLVYYF